MYTYVLILSRYGVCSYLYYQGAGYLTYFPYTGEGSFYILRSIYFYMFQFNLTLVPFNSVGKDAFNCKTSLRAF
jgi:hypothetical protein